MRLHRFYIDKPIEYRTFSIKDERLIHQWRDVFRYNVGSQVVLFDGSGNEFEAVLESINNREAEVIIGEQRKWIVPKDKITLCVSLIKKDNLELVVEKATELGVSKIIPIISERSEKKGFNLERAKKIAIEASEQCGRADVPEIKEVMNLESGIMNCNEDIIVFDPSGITTPPPSPLPLGEGAEGEVSIFIGPEGGWSPKELEIFKNKKARIYSMGLLVLRAETAAIAALSLFL